MTPRELLISGARELDIELSADQANSLFIHLYELKKWNRKINLTAIENERDVIIKHVLDSIAFLKGFDQKEQGRLLDLGSGAGFPALPLKIVRPGISLTLVESVKKKASFLRHVIRTLDLAGVEVIDKRTEEIQASSSAFYDFVTARAFATMTLAVSAGTPFLKPGGLLVLSRGPEEHMNEKDLLKARVLLEKKVEMTLPHSNYKRTIWVFKKTP